jgi:hypothetical protein
MIKNLKLKTDIFAVIRKKSHYKYEVFYEIIQHNNHIYYEREVDNRLRPFNHIQKSRSSK